ISDHELVRSETRYVEAARGGSVMHDGLEQPCGRAAVRVLKIPELPTRNLRPRKPGRHRIGGMERDPIVPERPIAVGVEVVDRVNFGEEGRINAKGGEYTAVS